MYQRQRQMWKRIQALMLSLLVCCVVLCGCAPDEEWTEETPDQTAGFRRTVLYYQTDAGQMVPVMKLLPWEEGIGRAALNQLVDTESNRAGTAMMGLKNVIPQGVSFVLSISDDAIATLNMQNLPDLGSAASENAMLTAVVNTLTEFPTIDQVQLTFDGEIRDAMPHGTPVGSPLRSLPLNEEPLPVNAPADALSRVTLYFPNQAASLNVPVTRYIAGDSSFAAAMAELVKGPTDETLRACFPEGTVLREATIVDTIASVDFSEPFAQLASSPALEEAALTAMRLTAQQFGTVSELEISVEGNPYESAAGTVMAAPMYANTFR